MRAILRNEHYAFWPEFADLRRELWAQASSPLCLCGQEKRRPGFCMSCKFKLSHVDERLAWTVEARLREFPDVLGLWMYDLCVDLLRDPHLGSWKPARRKKED